MSTDVQNVQQAAETLRQALEQVGDALASPDLDALLRGEMALEQALAGFGHAPSASGDRAAIRREVETAQAALLRCRRLGAALSEFTRASIDAQGFAPEYARSRTPAAVLAGRALNLRA